MTLIILKEESFTVLEHVPQEVARQMQQLDSAFLLTEDDVDWDYGY